MNVWIEFYLVINNHSMRRIMRTIIINKLYQSTLLLTLDNIWKKKILKFYKT